MKDIYQLEQSKLMHKFRVNTLSQSCDSFLQKITETHSHFTTSSGRQNNFYLNLALL